VSTDSFILYREGKGPDKTLRVKIEGGGEKCVCLTYLTLFKMKSQNL